MSQTVEFVLMGEGKEETRSLELRKVAKRFGPTLAVDHVTLHANAGEFLSLLGPSGCGKTTTLRLVAGFEQPDAGTILLGGRDVLNVPPYRRNVNTVFQGYALFPHMTVEENVAYGLRQKRVPKDEIRSRVREGLGPVRLLPLSRRYPRELSGGQQQRVALARALVNRPALLLLDEPLGSLDRKLRERMQVELKLLQSEVGITFVYVTHDQDEALSMSDRIAVMLEGRILQTSTPRSLYDRPEHPFVAAFIGRMNFFKGELDESRLAVRSESVVVRAAKRPPGVNPHDVVLAAVRPEHVRVTREPPPDRVNNVLGIVGSISYFGTDVEYVILVPSGPEVTSRIPAARHTEVGIGVREEVVCSWNDEDVRIFPFDERVQEVSQQRWGGDL